MFIPKEPNIEAQTSVHMLTHTEAYPCMYNTSHMNTHEYTCPTLTYHIQAC